MKQAQSGLRTLKRDFNTGAIPSQAIDVDDAEWPPTPPTEPKPLACALTGSELRLKNIQDALAGIPSSSSSSASTQPLTNKRPNPANSAGTSSSEPPMKRRVLPTSWEEAPGPKIMPPKRAIADRQKPSVTTTTTKAVATKGVATVFLSTEQQQILKLVSDGQSLFYTGSAGTGKSVLLREIIKTLRKKYVKSADAVAVTASTGIAACNIGGTTIHSFSGIGLGIEKAEDLANKVRKSKKAMARWLRTKVLIIDEVSMLDGDLFDKLARIGSILRKSTAPFGGIQVIVTGDFFQLPPVAKGQPTFAFEAKLWAETIKRTFNLTKVFRQHDQTFVDMLNEMRFGKLTDQSIKKFYALSRPIVYEDGLAPTELFPRREDVDRANRERMTRLSTAQESYGSSDGGTITEPNQRSKMLANLMAPTQLDLRVDAQVMLIKNLDENLVNGSIGKVIRFADPAAPDGDVSISTELGQGAAQAKTMQRKPGGKLYPVVQFQVRGGSQDLLVLPENWKVEDAGGQILASRTQLPLILAWAMSIHKSQGQTMERVKVDLGKIFEKGQAYVALSRATSLDGLQILNFRPDKVMAHPKVAAWSRSLETFD